MNQTIKVPDEPRRKRRLLREHMAKCPYKSALGRALWRAVF
jgi:hypothetical protein